jgi:hypothetical protein
LHKFSDLETQNITTIGDSGRSEKRNPERERPIPEVFEPPKIQEQRSPRGMMFAGIVASVPPSSRLSLHPPPQ